jgi:hypothetical protein
MYMHNFGWLTKVRILVYDMNCLNVCKRNKNKIIRWGKAKITNRDQPHKQQMKTKYYRVLDYVHVHMILLNSDMPQTDP